MEPGALAAGPEFGILGTLVAVVFYFMRSNRQDRREAATALAARDAAAAAQVSELKNEVTDLKKEVRDALRELEQERRLRYKAEERESVLRRQLGLPVEETTSG